MYDNATMDFETRSTTDLKKSGVHRYTEDINTFPWVLSYRLNKSGPMKRWRPGDPDPVDLLDLVRRRIRRSLKAHNAAFERMIWNNVICRRICPHWPTISIEQQDCTLSRAAAIDHPQGLDMLAVVVGAKHKKNLAGAAQMKKMMRPRRYNADGTITWWDSAEDRAILEDYCDDDVLAEEDVDTMIPPLTDSEFEVWCLDQKINERGVHFDTVAVRRCAELVELCKKQADATMRHVTGRAVPKCSSVKDLMAFLNARGIECNTLQKGDQDDLMYIADLRGDVAARRAIELRRAASKTSTAKYKAILECQSSDGCVRFLLQYHGAGPGRWAGRLVQPQNFPRVDEEEQYQIDWLHSLLANPSLSVRDIYDLIEVVHGPLRPLVLLSRALRSMITARPGCKLVGADFSNIEGRVSAWLAGEQWKLDAFREYDAGVGPDLYKLSYARSFGVDVSTVGKGRKRQIGKVQELSLGFQGSVGAFIGMGDNYDLDPYEVAAAVREATPQEVWQRVEAEYDTPGTNHYGFQRREWTALKVIVNGWRAAHPRIVQSWWDIQDGAIEAVSNPGSVVYCLQSGPNHPGHVQYYFDGATLWCVLPSGRMLCYPQARVETTSQTRYNKETGEPYERMKHTVYFHGVDPITKQWTDRALYGGLQFENIVQATARDLMVGGMHRIEAADYPIVLTVHDEIVAEPEVWRGLGVELFQELMAQGEEWSEGLPISVAAWEGERYVH